MPGMITEQEKKKLLVDMLNRLSVFLEKHGIPWFVYYGTLIGAIRHHGFIPWDDDIDIVIPRKDYFRLIHIIEKETDDLSENNLAFISYNAVEKSFHKRMKAADTRTTMIEYGKERPAVFIDIFPLDFIPRIEKLGPVRKRIKRLDNILVVLYSGKAYASGRKGLVQKAILMSHRLLGLKRMVAFYEKRVLRNEEPARWGGVAEDGYPHEFCEAASFRGTTMMPFETASVPCPSGYHEILTKCYGDYMTPPPEDERHSHEYYEMYWK